MMDSDDREKALRGALEENLELIELALLKKFPNHVFMKKSGSVGEYLMDNIRSAVVDDVIRIMETWIETMEEAKSIPRFAGQARDWEIAISHTRELISEINQYKVRGASAYTGNIRTQGEEN